MNVRVNVVAAASAAVAVAAAVAAGAPAVAGSGRTAPSVLLVTVDTLRADRLGSYGYSRPTSPNIDRLLASGARFTHARTVEPLTNPALASMVTGMLPHEHGASRNGLRLEPGLGSLSKTLADHGWRTAAVVSNWTLRDNISGLADHFGEYFEVFTRRRWFGLVNSEASGADVTDAAAEWLGDHVDAHSETPFLLWVHYVEPHAPYRFHDEYAASLGIENGDPPKEDRYDTEVAAVDHEIGRLLAELARHTDPDRVVIVFAADHGESLGEHDYWGHGRHLYEPSLRIPMGITWPDSIDAQVVEAPAQIIDIPTTVLELVGVAVPQNFRGFGWARVLRGREAASYRPFCYQAHKGAVHGARESDRARSKGLLSVAYITAERKEVLLVNSNERLLFDLTSDPGELSSLVTPSSPPSEELVRCVGEISTGLGSLDRLSTKKLDDETVEQLRALGYLE